MVKEWNANLLLVICRVTLGSAMGDAMGSARFFLLDELLSPSREAGM